MTLSPATSHREDRTRKNSRHPERSEGPLYFSLACALLFTATTQAQIPEQYPKPLIHTPTDHPAARAIIVSVDGLHAYDLANFVAAHPQSTLAALTAHGVTYTNARTPWADPAAGLLAFATGGTPISTGIVSADAGPLPALKVNTIFEVVHQKIGPTAWAGESPATTDLLRGPTGKGLDDASNPATDELRLAAVLHQIDGRDSSGTRPTPVPALFGMSFAAIAAAQSTAGMGYADAIGTPSAGLARSLDTLDAALGKIVSHLKAAALNDSTWIFVAAPYAQAPIRRRMPLAAIKAISPAIARVSGGDVAILWMQDRAATQAVLRALEAKAAVLGIADIYSGERLALILTSPARDPRMPDIVLEPQPGLAWTADTSHTAIAAHGGLSDQDTHVALLISGAQLTGRFDPTPVPTTQLAPLLLRALGMEKFDLDALHMEHTPALPGIF
jgi:hypothetical protein